MNNIPKIIHQIWIGDKVCPVKLINSVKEKHPEIDHILWTKEEIIKRNMSFICQQRIDEIEAFCGKADIMRYEILYKYGGIYLDADSLCLESLDEFFFENTGFAVYENEKLRNGLIANGTLGFVKNHPLLKDMIDHIKNNEVSFSKTEKQPWQNTGPLLLTTKYNTGLYNDVKIYPSYYFYPIHQTGSIYNGHKKVYFNQMWGSTFNLYNSDNKINSIKEPDIGVSLLIISFNTNNNSVNNCLESILNQEGNFNIEIVWIDDGSEADNSLLIEKSLKYSRYIKIVYCKNEKNTGNEYSIDYGKKLCSNKLIIQLNSGDNLKPDHIKNML
jgi:mannosyltransferase OCH1-like enzyme